MDRREFEEALRRGARQARMVPPADLRVRTLTMIQARAVGHGRHGGAMRPAVWRRGPVWGGALAAGLGLVAGWFLWYGSSGSGPSAAPGTVGREAVVLDPLEMLSLAGMPVIGVVEAPLREEVERLVQDVREGTRLIIESLPLVALQ